VDIKYLVVDVKFWVVKDKVWGCCEILSVCPGMGDGIDGFDFD
jgi:hypothetical protein